MVKSRFIVVDSDALSGNALSRILSESGHSVSISSIKELRYEIAESCTIFVSDIDDQLAEVIDVVRDRGVFYPIVPYGHAPAPQRVVATIRHGAVSYLDWPCSQERVLSVLSTIGETSDVLFKSSSARTRAFPLLKSLTPRPTAVQIHREVRTTKEGVAMLIKPARVGEVEAVPIVPAKPASSPGASLYGPHRRNVN